MMRELGASMQRRVWLLIAATTLIRLAFAASLGLGVDESYMVSAGRALSLGYFDHPPAAWWLSWGAAQLSGTETPVAVRLPFIALFAVSTWLMTRLGSAVADERAGFWAAVLLNLSPVFGVTGGSWVLPDGPLLCALLGAALCLVHAVSGRGRMWWFGAGVCAGLALFAKYSAVLTIGGAFLFLVCDRRYRHWLRRPEPYLAALIAGLVFAPVIVWNARHGWASFAFQGERAVGLRFRPLAPVTTLLGEGLFVLPWIWAPMLVLLVRGFRSDGHDRLLVWLAAPPIAAFAMISAWSSQRVLFHWAAPGYLMLFPLLGREVAARIHLPWVRRAIAGTAALVIVAMAVVGLQTRFDFLGDRLAATMRKDPTIEGIDWVSLRTELTERGLLPKGAVVGVANWRDGGKIAYALGPDVTVLCLNADSRQFGFAHPLASHIGEDVLLLALTPAPVAGLFERVEALPPATVQHRGRVLQAVSVSVGRHLRVSVPP
jgi:4-amino-4-deoxy-L-arabinose transferase-like glycosyltransferase